MDKTKKSSAVPATLLAAFAASLLTGCASHPREVRRCVDDKGKVMDDRYCETGYYRGSAIYNYPRFVYGGSGGMTPGTMARGFRASPSGDADVVTPGGRVISRSVRRGGFGSSSSGYSGGFG